MPEFASEDEVNACRIPHSGMCWWCGDAATTREHKFKLSDLKRMSAGDPEPLVWGNSETSASIRSIRKSERVKFAANLCADCNNARSQKFDYAYEKFSTHVWSKKGRMWRARHIDMREVFGDTWTDDVLDLARYIVKHAGCRIANDGFAVPSNFADFLNGGDFLENFQVCAFKDREIYRAQRRIAGPNGDPLGLWIGPMDGRVNRSENRLTGFGSTLSIGFIGFVYRWYAHIPETDPFYLYQKARIHRLDTIPAI